MTNSKLNNLAEVTYVLLEGVWHHGNKIACISQQ